MVQCNLQSNSLVGEGGASQSHSKHTFLQRISKLAKGSYVFLFVISIRSSFRLTTFEHYSGREDQIQYIAAKNALFLQHTTLSVCSPYSFIQTLIKNFMVVDVPQVNYIETCLAKLSYMSNISKISPCFENTIRYIVSMLQSITISAWANYKFCTI